MGNDDGDEDDNDVDDDHDDGEEGQPAKRVMMMPLIGGFNYSIVP